MLCYKWHSCEFEQHSHKQLEVTVCMCWKKENELHSKWINSWEATTIISAKTHILALFSKWFCFHFATGNSQQQDFCEYSTTTTYPFKHVSLCMCARLRCVVVVHLCAYFWRAKSQCKMNWATKRKKFPSVLYLWIYFCFNVWKFRC